MPEVSTNLVMPTGLRTQTEIMNDSTYLVKSYGSSAFDGSIQVGKNTRYYQPITPESLTEPMTQGTLTALIPHFVVPEFLVLLVLGLTSAMAIVSAIQRYGFVPISPILYETFGLFVGALMLAAVARQLAKAV